MQSPGQGLPAGQNSGNPGGARRDAVRGRGVENAHPVTEIEGPVSGTEAHGSGNLGEVASSGRWGLKARPWWPAKTQPAGLLPQAEVT